MAVHFLHVSKAGGSAIRYAFRKARRTAGGELVTPWGPIESHRHSFGLHDVPKGDKAIFALRDPVARFLSGFYSRQRQGAPRYVREWSNAERQSFEWFATPRALADALAEPPSETRKRAEFAMESIRHLRRRLTLWTGDPAYFRKHLDQVLYIARQETLDDDWQRLKELLELPAKLALPRDDVVAHRTAYPHDRSISDRGIQALRAWYAADYEVLQIGEDVRQGRISLPSRLDRLASPARSRR
jgi:Sulfotransferase family